MSKIVRYNDWGCWDQLDGKTIENGERLHVDFPSGKLVLVEAHVVTIGSKVNDHGHECDISNVHAYWKTMVEGVDVLVPLVGLEARRLCTNFGYYM